VELIREYVPLGARVLEIGCGKGTTAVWLAQQGYRVVACDVSAEAVRQARQRAEAADAAARFLVADVLADAAQLPPTDVIFTRGVLHTYVTPAGRAAFVAAVAGCLQAGGLWLDISGSADTLDAPGDRIRFGLPRLTLVELASAVEPHFEVLAVRRAVYGITPDRTDFLAWASASRRRH
jgi:SAM-dependent methyltransferase